MWVFFVHCHQECSSYFVVSICVSLLHAIAKICCECLHTSPYHVRDHLSKPTIVHRLGFCHRLAAQLLESDPFMSVTILTPYKRQRAAIMLQLEMMGLLALIPRVFVVSGAQFLSWYVNQSLSVHQHNPVVSDVLAHSIYAQIACANFTSWHIMPHKYEVADKLQLSCEV